MLFWLLIRTCILPYLMSCSNIVRINRQDFTERISFNQYKQYFSKTIRINALWCAQPPKRHTSNIFCTCFVALHIFYWHISGAPTQTVEITSCRPFVQCTISKGLQAMHLNVFALQDILFIFQREFVFLFFIARCDSVFLYCTRFALLSFTTWSGRIASLF